MKNTLYASKAASKSAAFFWGALFPYLISWSFYQGQTLLNLLNYAGLIINGLVAFILPLFLTLHATHIHRRKKMGYVQIPDGESRIGSISSDNGMYLFVVFHCKYDFINILILGQEIDGTCNRSFALPAVLAPYRRELIIFIIASYIAIIVCTVVDNTIETFM